VLGLFTAFHKEERKKERNKGRKEERKKGRKEERKKERKKEASFPGDGRSVEHSHFTKGASK